MKITDEMVENARMGFARVETASLKASFENCMRAALQSVLPDIEREVREECAQLAKGMDSVVGGEMIAYAIRSLPPSTQD
jgi:hypothetical protein